MVAAMSSLALLAHTAAPPPPAFNSTFYATAATIIPVLFLAIAAQGPFFEELLALTLANTRRIRQDPQLRESALRTFAAVDIAGAPLRIAALILIYGAVAEILALTALYQQHASAFTGAYVLTGTIFLSIMAVFRPAMTLVRTMIQVAREDRLHSRAQPIIPEHGKTDTERPIRRAARPGGHRRGETPARAARAAPWRHA
jgi:hypothetical protein